MTYSTNRYLVHLVVVLVVMGLYGIVAWYGYTVNTSYRKVALRVEKILEIKELLDKTDKELLGVVSLYDPEKTAKVEF